MRRPTYQEMPDPNDPEVMADAKRLEEEFAQEMKEMLESLGGASGTKEPAWPPSGAEKQNAD